MVRACDCAQFGALLLALFAVAPLFYPGCFQSHSGLLSIYDLYDFERSGGPAWIATVGSAADPVRNAGPLGYVVAAIAHALGASATQAIMASYALAFLVAAWAMARWIRNITGGSGAAGLLGATIYTYLPYHLSTVYVRGDLGEAWAFALWPLLFWAAHRLAARKRLSALITTAILWGLLSTANQGLALLTLPALAGYLWLAAGMRARWGAVTVAIGVALPTAVAHGWAGRFAAPVDFGAHFPYLFQLLSPAWNAAGQAGEWLNGMPLQIGLAALGLGVLAAMLCFRTGVPAMEDAPESDQACACDATAATRVVRVVRFWLAVAFAGWVMMWAPSLPIWRATGFAHLITYPWQALGLVGLGLAVAGGAAVRLDQRLRGEVVRAALICFVVLGSYGYLAPRFFDFAINFTPEAKVEHTYVMTPRSAPVAVFGDNLLALLDYRVEGPLRHGATIRVNVLWQALQPLPTDYVVFVHAVDDGGTIRGQRDVEPQDGQLPTSQWGEGQLVADRYELQIAVDGPREGYQLVIGVYRKGTDERLAAGSATEVGLPGE